MIKSGYKFTNSLDVTIPDYKLLLYIVYINNVEYKTPPELFNLTPVQVATLPHNHDDNLFNILRGHDIYQESRPNCTPMVLYNPSHPHTSRSIVTDFIQYWPVIDNRLIVTPQVDKDGTIYEHSHMFMREEKYSIADVQLLARMVNNWTHGIPVTPTA